MRVLALFSLAPLLVSASADFSVPLSVRQCRAMPAPTARALGVGWGTLAAFVQRCTVPGPDRRPALTVDVVRVDLAYTADFFARTHWSEELPLPIIRDRSGVVVGELPDQFPENPPGKLRVTFAKWRNGWPQEIRLFEAGESALAPHALPPLRWDAQTRTYRERR